MRSPMPGSWKKNTAVFMTSQAISLFGSSLVQFAITWYITLTTQSGVYMTISILCSMLPLLFLSPLAGVWADRYNRKTLIMLSDGAIALSTLLLAIVFLMGYKAVWLLFVVQALRSLGGAIQSPAISAMLPDLVPEEQLTRINGINGSIQSLLSLASPALAGVLLNVVGSIESIFFIDVVTAAIAIVIMLRYLYVPTHVRTETEAKSQLTEMREGIRYVRSQPHLMHMMAFMVIICFCIAPIAFLTPLQVVRSYGEEIWRLTAIEIAFSGGMLLGGLLISAWGGLKNRVHMIALSVLVMGGLTILLGLPTPFWLYLTIMVLLGLSLPLFNTPGSVFIQETVDPSYLGRVFSFVSMINGGLMPMGMLLFGPLADAIPIEWLLIGTGAVIFLSAIALFLDPVALQAGRLGRDARKKHPGPITAKAEN